jgi:3-methyl-2-oxobutanoate hydroxymethyltransferase
MAKPGAPFAAVANDLARGPPSRPFVIVERCNIRPSLQSVAAVLHSIHRLWKTVLLQRRFGTTGGMRIHDQSAKVPAICRRRDLSKQPKPKKSGATQRISVADIRARKGGVPLVCLTAYTTPVAQRLDPHVDLLLVGDSLAMVIYGMKTTVGVTLDTMINHGAAVLRGARRACVIIDRPYGSYEASPDAAFASATRAMKETGAQGVKLEGGVEMADTVRHLVGRNIPVLGHVGLLPQKVTDRSGYRIQGKDDAGWKRVLADAEAIAAAGAFAIVLEGTVEPLARHITETVAVPIIGIGASPACDGQILVTDDVLGVFSDFKPTFVRRYAELGDEIEHAARAYAEDVRQRQFPGPEHCFPLAKGKD